MSIAHARLTVTSVAKNFGATRALVDGSLQLEPGEVHTVLGENGSGKSTLVKILSGVHRPDGGEVQLDGTVVHFRSPREARRKGIATVFQEVLTVASQTVLENVWLGTDGIFRNGVRAARRRSAAAEALVELLDGPIDLDAEAGDLSLSDRQAICIARALVTDPRLLILDESTAALDIATRDRLFAVIRRLTAAGTSVLFISHRMDEIAEISDRVSVLRSGSTVAAGLDREHSSAKNLLGLMTGGEGLVERRCVSRRAGSPVLKTTGLRIGHATDHLDFELRAGELVGLAGLEGQGQQEFLLSLAGLRPSDDAVRCTLDDGSEAVVTTRSAHRLGIAYVPKDRRGEAIFPEMSIRENFALPTIDRDTNAGLIRERSSAERLRAYISELSIKLRSSSDPIASLSGGNQQKVIVARWLASSPRVLLLNDPTRGVDIGAKHDLYAMLERICESGVSVVMLSSEMDELIELMDRVLVFRENKVFAEIDRSSLSRPALVSAYFGQTEERAA